MSHHRFRFTPSENVTFWPRRIFALALGAGGLALASCTQANLAENRPGTQTQARPAVVRHGPGLGDDAPNPGVQIMSGSALNGYQGKKGPN